MKFFIYAQIRYLYKAMENHWNIFTSEFEMRILKNYSILSRKFTLIYASECLHIRYINKLILYVKKYRSNK